MITKPMLDFINGQMSQGMTREAITKMLMSEGWTSSDVDEAYLSMKPPTLPTPPPAPAAPIPPILPTPTPVITPTPTVSMKPVAPDFEAMFSAAKSPVSATAPAPFPSPSPVSAPVLVAASATAPISASVPFPIPAPLPPVVPVPYISPVVAPTPAFASSATINKVLTPQSPGQLPITPQTIPVVTTMYAPRPSVLSSSVPGQMTPPPVNNIPRSPFGMTQQKNPVQNTAEASGTGVGKVDFTNMNMQHALGQDKRSTSRILEAVLITLVIALVVVAGIIIYKTYFMNTAAPAPATSPSII